MLTPNSHHQRISLKPRRWDYRKRRINWRELWLIIKKAIETNFSRQCFHKNQGLDVSVTFECPAIQLEYFSTIQRYLNLTGYSNHFQKFYVTTFHRKRDVRATNIVARQVNLSTPRGMGQSPILRCFGPSSRSTWGSSSIGCVSVD